METDDQFLGSAAAIDALIERTEASLEAWDARDPRPWSAQLCRPRGAPEPHLTMLAMWRGRNNEYVFAESLAFTHPNKSQPLLCGSRLEERVLAPVRG